MLDSHPGMPWEKSGEAMSLNPILLVFLHLKARRLLCTRWAARRLLLLVIAAPGRHRHAEPVKTIEPADSGSVQNSWSDSFKKLTPPKRAGGSATGIALQICAFVSCDTSKLATGAIARAEISENHHNRRRAYVWPAWADHKPPPANWSPG